MVDKRKNEMVVIGTVYPAIEKHIGDYFSSLYEQSFDKFDVLVANDGINKFDIPLASDKNFNKIINVNGTISDNRRNLICTAIEMGYEKIVFTDCDDTFEKKRLEVTNDLLDHNNIVVNDLDITDEAGVEKESRYFSRRFNQEKKINIDMVRYGNLLGLSNTAISVESLREISALREGDSIAFDWYLWSCILEAGQSALFTSSTSTKYRIYGENTAGLPQILNEADVCKGIEVKRQHYFLMNKFHDTYYELHQEFEELSVKWKNKTWRPEYISALRHNSIENHMWWENIRPLSEVGLV